MIFYWLKRRIGRRRRRIYDDRWFHWTRRREQVDRNCGDIEKKKRKTFIDEDEENQTLKEKKKKKKKEDCPSYLNWWRVQQRAEQQQKETKTIYWRFSGIFGPSVTSLDSFQILFWKTNLQKKSIFFKIDSWKQNKKQKKKQTRNNWRQ